jgi:spore maturation protein SpmB
MKVLSGAGARGLMVDVLQTHGVDSFAAGWPPSSRARPTTFYVLAVYFGSVGVRHTRHALVCALVADAVGLLAAIGLAYALWR